MVVQAVLDDREVALAAALDEVLRTLSSIPGGQRAKGPPPLQHRRERLALGDVLLRQDDGARAGSIITILVERKTQADLLASVTDGRLVEQCHRMEGWQAQGVEDGGGATEERWIVLLVEDGGCDEPRQRHHRWFLKVYLQSALHWGEGVRRLVLRTRDVTESALLLLTLHKTVRAFGGALPPPPSAATEDGVPPAVVVALPVRGPGPVYLRQLRCIQGVSTDRARLIAGLYPSLRDLVLATATTEGAAAVQACLAVALRNRPLAGRVVAAVSGAATTTTTKDDDGDAPCRPAKRPRHGAPVRRLAGPRHGKRGPVDTVQSADGAQPAGFRLAAVRAAALRDGVGHAPAPVRSSSTVDDDPAPHDGPPSRVVDAPDPAPALCACSGPRE